MSAGAPAGGGAGTGVLLINLGTPRAPEAGAIRAFLRAFLSDPRVIEIPRLLWLPILHLGVLPLRPRRLVPAYRAIWMAGGSPLMVHSEAQRDALGARLARRGAGAVAVELAMCYGEPSFETALARLAAAGAERLLALPLYPQYSASTQGAAFDALAAALARRRRVPAVRFVDHYFDAPAYIRACAARVRAHRAEHGAGDKLLLSFHGLPRRCVALGDPYERQCRETARLLAAELGLADQDWALSFQSRFGRAEWVKPYTTETLEALAASGARTVEVFCPGFAADCLETLEEIAMQNRDAFLAAGGKDFRYIPALNASEAHIECLAELVAKHAGDWLPDAPRGGG